MHPHSYWPARARPSPSRPHPFLEFDGEHDHEVLSRAGRHRQYGPDQCVNDRDGTVDHDERLRITGVTPGRYDAKFQDKKGRVCVVKNIDVKAGGIFSIEERQVSNCQK